MGLPNSHFTHIFVDEAGEALEPETLIPIYLANPNTSIVLAGDHLQLGPIVRSATAMEWKYDRSLMERLLNTFKDKFVCKLIRSYRAHPAIMHLYNYLFYNGELINCADARESSSLLKWKELTNPSIPIFFVHSEDQEARDHDSPSWYNFAEKEIVMKIVKQLLDDSSLLLTPNDIGIITPYRKQVQKINQLAHFMGSPYNGCKVGTVENFQGQERKVIILSLVRSREVNLAHDSKFKLGFCDNPKRLNVAISRAKELLIIIGNGTLFGSNDPNWHALLTYFEQNNLFKGVVPKWKFTPKKTSSPTKQ
jgi:helicase MOV-10